MSGVLSSLSAMPPIWEYSFVLNSAAYSTYTGMWDGLFGSTSPAVTTPPFGTRILQLYYNSAAANRVSLGFNQPFFPMARIIQIHVDGSLRYTCSVWDAGNYIVRTPAEAITNYLSVGARSIRLVGLS